MTIKIILVGRFSGALKLIYDDNKEEIIAFDEDFDDPFETEIWEPLIAEANNIIDTSGLRGINKEDTQRRNDYMDAELPILDELEYKIKACRRAGTITALLSTFALSAFKKCIPPHKIDVFHECFLWTMSKVNENKAALIAKGFTQDKIDAIKDNHDKAMEIQGNKDELKDDISELSESNQKVIDDVMTVNKSVMAVIKAYAKSIGDKELEKKVTVNAILSTLRPTPEKKPRVRNIKPGREIILRTDMNPKNVLQLLLLTDTIVKIGLTKLKTEEVTVGKELTLDEQIEVKTSQIPGSGKYVKLKNLDLNNKAKIRVFEVKIVGS